MAGNIIKFIGTNAKAKIRLLNKYFSQNLINNIFIDPDHVVVGPLAIETLINPATSIVCAFGACELLGAR